ncbi:hypothetical protein BCR15_07340 [Tessaracoccus lapidicaptus]|uniref:Uncharacterized protein n=1 Tax=Tessaracoccus lapidicaptus TaxID=1427523 RepID=A0A1C0AKD7_9ACTN|nr:MULTISPECIES: 1-propanol dehydrogenase PduQ [Tessaracoccus]AQX16856.1 hypothetical protein BKM78_13740 [Tessaracoccus sp. T2.5-30]OCL33082.1 hypothetical protein BCR15_07340 [Tessaracoccus lapidicaptus]VEP41645.1 NAD-dependent methanol dehydrogenase [Tessaracoccus lapidicaptus]
MGEFGLGPTLLHGAGALDALSQFAGERVLVVTDTGIAGTPTLGIVREHLAGAEITVFDGVTPDPSTTVVAEGLAAYYAAGPHAVVAVGGGSVIDAAKAMHLIATQQGRGAPWGLAVVPTTSGSGSEVTSVAVVTDEVNQVKIPLIDQRLMPRLAILDPVAVRGCPPRVSMDAGMDALTHAVEAYVATGASDFSDAFAEKAVQLIRTWLPVVHRDPGNLEARERMHNAATLAAVAFENAGLGLTHSLAHAIGGHFHVAHGRLNSVLLPHVIGFNAGDAAAAERYYQLALDSGLDPAGRRSGATKLRSAVQRLAGQVEMPHTLTEAGVDPVEFHRAVDTLAAQALADGCTPFNPVCPTQRDLRALLRSAL